MCNWALFCWSLRQKDSFTSGLETQCNFPMLPSHALCWQGRGVGVEVRVGVTATSSSHDAPLPAQWHTLRDVTACGWDQSTVRCQIYISTGCWWKPTDVMIWKRSGFMVKSHQQPHTHWWTDVSNQNKSVAAWKRHPFMKLKYVSISLFHSHFFNPVISHSSKVIQ